MSIRIFSVLGISLVCIAVMIAGCANENQPYYSIPTVQLKGGNCLKEATGTVDRYVKGQAKAQEVEGLWDCAAFAVKTFRDKVEGSNPNGYEATELRDFLERYFLGGTEKDAIKLDDPLLRELMEVKRLFVGGSSTFITKSELVQTDLLIREFREITVALLPHVKLLFYQNEGDVPSNDQVDTAAEQIIYSFEKLGSIIEKNGVSYDFVRFNELLRQIDRLFKKQGNEDTFDGLTRFIPMFAKLKGILLNSTSEKILGGEWKVTLSTIGRSFSLYLRGYFFLNQKSMFDLSRLDQFEKMGRMVVGLISEAYSRRNNEPIRHEEVDPLLEDFADLSGGSLPFGLTIEQFKTMWRTVVDKILSEASKNAPGLSRSEVAVIEREFEDWLNIQRWLLGATGTQPKNDSIEEMQLVLATPWPLSLDVEGRLVFTPDPNAQWNMEAMSRMNWLRGVFKLVLRAYTKDRGRREGLIGLDKKEFEEAYQDLKPFLVAMGLVDEKNTTFGEKVLREAGLFTSRGNGDHILNFVEIVEYVHYILAGIDTGELFVERAKEDCPIVSDAMQAQCFRMAFRKYFSDRYAHLPLMVSYTSTLSDKGWSKLLKALEVANRDEGNANTPIKTSDIYAMGVLLQYIETAMLRFDANLSGTLDVREALMALPLFENVLAEFADMDPKKDAKNIRAIFTYMLKYGEPPDKKNVLSLLKFLLWRMNEKSWKLNADRGVLLQILSSLSSL